MTAKEAHNAEFLAFRAVVERINQGVTAADSKVAVLKLVQDYGHAARRAEAIEAYESAGKRVALRRGSE